MSSEIAELNGAAAQASRSRVASQKLTEDFDNFLLILTTQLQNQDPLSPMDTHEFTNQLVLFAGVEQSIAQNDSLEKLIALQSSNQAAAAVSYIGRTVQAKGNAFQLTGDGATLHYELPEAAKTATLTVLDSANSIVLFTPLQGKDAGENSFAWDGKNAAGSPLPPGRYSFRINAVNANEAPITPRLSVEGQVDGVEIGPGGTILTVGDTKVKLDDVFRIKQAAGANA